MELPPVFEALTEALAVERERMGFVWTGTTTDGPAMWARDRDGGLHALVSEAGWEALTEGEWRGRWPDATVPPRLSDDAGAA